QRGDVFLRRIGVDVEDDFDAVEAVAYVAVYAKDALQVHARFERRLDRVQLNAAILRHGGDAGRQAGGKTDEDILHRRRTLVLGGEDFRMIGVINEVGLVRLLGAQSVKAAYDGTAVGA